MKITVDKFGTTPQGEQVDIITVENDNGALIKVTNYGAKLVALTVPDKKGQVEDLVFGYKTLEDYLSGNRFFGSNPGRFANRIANAQFEIDGVTYDFEPNDGANLLHGGEKAFDNVVWSYDVQGSSITFHYTSPDGEGGFPGELKTTITYRWSNDYKLTIDYVATTSKPTHVNLTHHSYFNLNGESYDTIFDHIITINSSYVLEVNEGLIPTGKYLTVENTPLDLREGRLVGAVVDSDFPSLKNALGFDHCYVIDKEGEGLAHCAHVLDPRSGRTMDVYTTLPGMQFYTCNHPNGLTKGKSDKIYPIRGAFCLEPQFFPNTPNIPSFPSTLLKPNKEYNHTIIYQFNKKH